MAEDRGLEAGRPEQFPTGGEQLSIGGEGAGGITAGASLERASGALGSGQVANPERASGALGSGQVANPERASGALGAGQEWQAGGQSGSGLPERKDEDLLAQIRLGNREALELLCSRYTPLARHLARQFYLPGGEREDLEQEGMIGLLRAIQEFDFQAGAVFFHFAKLCIYRQIVSAIRSAGRHKHAPLNSFVDLDAMERELHFPSPEEQVLMGERWRARMERLWQRLSPLERRVLGMQLEGKSNRDMEIWLDKDKKSLDNGKQRIRRKLREILSEE